MPVPITPLPCVYYFICSCLSEDLVFTLRTPSLGCFIVHICRLNERRATLCFNDAEHFIVDGRSCRFCIAMPIQPIWGSALSAPPLPIGHPLPLSPSISPQHVCFACAFWAAGVFPRGPPNVCFFGHRPLLMHSLASTAKWRISFYWDETCYLLPPLPASRRISWLTHPSALISQMPPPGAQDMRGDGRWGGGLISHPSCD